MPTKKQKPARKTASKAKSMAGPEPRSEYSISLVSIMLYIWNALILFFTALSASALIESTNNFSSFVSLYNLLMVALLLILALLIFRTAQSLTQRKEDGFIAAVVILLNAAVFGYQGVGWGIPFNVPFWSVFTMAIMGLILLGPYMSRLYKTETHSLSTWSIVVHLLIWFMIVVVAPLVSTNLPLI